MRCVAREAGGVVVLENAAGIAGKSGELARLP